MLIPSSIETDEINATEQCATTLLDQSLDVAPPHNFANESGIDPGLAEIDENTTHLASNESAPSAPDVEPPVVTFEEWTKQKLEQEKLKHHVSRLFKLTFHDYRRQLFLERDKW